MVLAGRKIVAEEVKHPNNSCLEAMVSTVLSKRIPFHDELVLANWFACMNGLERWRVLHHRLKQATATLLLFDQLDIIGRAGEAARLSGVELAHSFPGKSLSQASSNASVYLSVCVYTPLSKYALNCCLSCHRPC